MVRPLKAAIVVSTKPDSFSVSVWIATCTSISSATDRQLSMAAGVVPQSSCSFRPMAPASTCSSSAAGQAGVALAEEAEVHREARRPPAACECDVPRPRRAGGGVGAGGRAGAAAEHGGDAADISASSICCGQMKWMWVSMPPAVTIMPSPAMTSVPGADRRWSTPGWMSGLPALPIAGDAAVLDADVGLDDAPVRRRSARW